MLKLLHAAVGRRPAHPPASSTREAAGSDEHALLRSGSAPPVMQGSGAEPLLPPRARAANGVPVGVLTRHDLQHRRGGAPLYLLEPNPEPPAQQPELTLVEEEGEGEEELRRADGGSADVADRGV